MIIIGIAIATSYYIWSDSIQKAIFPKKYWQEEVDSSERAIKVCNEMIRCASRDLRKIQLTARIDIAYSMDSAESLGMTKEDARKMAVKKVNDEIEENKRLIKQLTEFNERCRQELEIEKKELEKYK